jgi:hypothetical protein
MEQPLEEIPAAEMFCLSVTLTSPASFAVFANRLRGLAQDGSPAGIFSVIVYFLPFRQRDFNFDQVLLEIETGRHQRQPSLLRPSGQLVDFVAIQQETPLAQRDVVHITSRGVLADVTIQKPDLPVANHGVTVLQMNLPLADRLDLGSREFNPCFELFQQMIEMARLAIDGKIPNLRICRFAGHTPWSMHRALVKGFIVAQQRPARTVPASTQNSVA